MLSTVFGENYHDKIQQMHQMAQQSNLPAPLIPNSIDAPTNVQYKFDDNTRISISPVGGGYELLFKKPGFWVKSLLQQDYPQSVDDCVVLFEGDEEARQAILAFLYKCQAAHDKFSTSNEPNGQDQAEEQEDQEEQEEQEDQEEQEEDQGPAASPLPFHPLLSIIRMEWPSSIWTWMREHGSSLLSVSLAQLHDTTKASHVSRFIISICFDCCQESPVPQIPLPPHCWFSAQALHHKRLTCNLSVPFRLNVICQTLTARNLTLVSGNQLSVSM